MRRFLPLCLLLSLGFSQAVMAEPAESSALETRSLSESEAAELQQLPNGMSDDAAAAYTDQMDDLYSTGDVDTAFAIIEDPDLVLGYHEATGMYTYTLPDGSRFAVSVPNTAVTTQAVRLVLPENMLLQSCTKDGEDQYALSKELTEPGSYTLQLLETGEASYDADNPTELQNTNSYRFTLHFRICENVNNLLELVQAPEGFQISAVSRNGKRSEEPRSWYFLPGDGSYVFEFRSLENDIPYELRFTLDETPPRLSFTGLGENSIAKSPLSVSSAEPCTVEVQHNGENYHLSQDQQQNIQGSLSGTGVYRLTAEDAAGNSRSYVVLLKGRSRLPSLLKGIFFLGLAAFLSIVMVGKKMLVGKIR